MALQLTKCPNCGSGKLKPVRRELTRMFKGKPYVVPAVEFHECPKCGEQIYGREAMRQIEAHSPAYAKTRAHA